MISKDNQTIIDKNKSIISDKEAFISLMGDGVIPKAAKNNQLEITKFLLSKDTETIFDENVFKAYNIYWLLNSAKHGSLDIIKFLLSSNIKIEETFIGYAAINAAESNHLNIIKFLLDKKFLSDSFFCYFSAQTLNTSINHGHLDIINFLLSSDIEFKEFDIGYAALKATKLNNVSILKLLLSNGRKMDQNHFTLVLSEAAKSGFLDIITELVQPENIANTTYIEPFIELAKENNHQDIVNYF